VISAVAAPLNIVFLFLLINISPLTLKMCVKLLQSLLFYGIIIMKKYVLKYMSSVMEMSRQDRIYGEKMDEKKVIINEKKPTDLMTSDFDYYLPEELIAQHPMAKRDHSRLMVLDRNEGSITHKHFYDILDYINPEDVLVINDSNVIPARTEMQSTIITR
jgi:hypothetical protein